MTCILYLLLTFCACGKFVPCTNRLINIIITILYQLLYTNGSNCHVIACFRMVSPRRKDHYM